MSVLLWSGLVHLPVDAVKATHKKTAVSQPRIPADSVSAAEAIQQIEAHMKTIAERESAMAALYDYKPSMATMKTAFQQNGANQWAIDMYASTWGQNGLYLTWDVTERFYDAHFDALKQSVWDIKMKKMGTVKKADLAYLDQGMTAWTAKEKEVQARFLKYTEEKGKTGSLAGQRHEVWTRMFGNAELKKMLTPQYDALGKQQENQGKIAGSLDTELRNIGYKTRLFSAITATERIPVAATTEPKQERCEPIRPGEVPRAYDYFRVGL